jgi:phospholipid/cholesterol/gamma-HCH transport system permease protein
MSDQGTLSVDSADGRTTWRLAGAWRLAALAAIEPELARSVRAARPAAIDGSALSELDSAAALVLLRCLGGAEGLDWSGFKATHARILAQVGAQLAAATEPVAARRESVLAHVGRVTLAIGALLGGHLNHLGLTVAALLEALLHPSRLRLRETTVQIEQAGLNAIPVVALVTLLIGVVVTYLLGLQAEKYGANIFVVDGVGIGATREFAPIIVAIIVAGRSGAAFTAQLGSMRLTEETDAIRTLGLSPSQVLIVPRVLALMLSLPLLVFVGDVMSLIGAMAIAAPMLDITPVAFLARLREELALRHVFAGLTKAPVFALAIAVIGVRMGMTVGRDTRALGEATTSTVVQSIVAVILLDAAFAVALQALGW